MKAKKHILLMMLVMLCSLFCFGSISSSAATPKYLKQHKLSFDLKDKKYVKYYSKFSGIGYRAQYVRLSKYKVKNSGKYKVATFTLDFKRKWKLSKSQVHEIVDDMYYDSVGGYVHYSILNYKTGKCVAPSGYYMDDTYYDYDWYDYENPNDITVSDSGIIWGDSTYYYDRDGCYVYLKNGKVKVTVKYPKNYKNLCIVAGGSNTILDYYTNGEHKYMMGKLQLHKSPYYNKKKHVACLKKIN